MKKPTNSDGKKGKPLLLVLLAILCIGSAELTASYFFDHALYQQITAPIRRGLQAAADACRYAAAETVSFGGRVADGIAGWWAEVTAPAPDLDGGESQVIGDPIYLRDEAISDPSITELALLDGQAVLTGGILPVVYYNQGDSTWAGQPYGTDDIGRYGCGPVAMAMAVSSMTDEQVDPVQMAEKAVSGGYWAKRGGSYLSIVNGLAKAYGLDSSPLSERTPEVLQETILSGNLVVALMGPGHFTQRGHFILLRGVTLNGSILVADPSSEERSLMEWDPQMILDELSRSTHDGAPVWVLSSGV